ITHVHNPWLHMEANYAVTPVRRLTAIAGKRLVHSFATNVCGTSAAILRQYGFPPIEGQRPAVSVLHCGIDVGKFNAPRHLDRKSVLNEFGWPDEVRIVLFAGRLDRSMEFDHPQNHKNSWLALNIGRSALGKQPAVRLLMAGDGDESRKELEQRIEHWGLTDQL